MERRLVLPKKSHTGPSLSYEQKAWKNGHQLVAGVDEAGRGPLAGPVVVAAVILGPSWDETCPLNDSKKLSLAMRESLFDTIRKNVLAYRIVAISPKIVDRLNILQASLFGMERSVRELKTRPDYVLVDGNKYPSLDLPGEPIVKGDSLSMSIAAASILAKVARDRVMVGYNRVYPNWGFERHKGYPTVQHRNAVAEHGLSPIHRRSFRSRPTSEQMSLL